MGVKTRIINWSKAFILPAIVWIVFAIITKGRFSTLTSLLSVLRTAVVPLLIAMCLSFGMTMNMWNFAAGAIVYACAIFSAHISSKLGIGIPGLCVLSIVLGVVFCGLMGWIYRYLRVPCLVLSLGVAMVIEGLPGILIEDGTGKISLFEGFLGSAPWCYIIFIVMFALFVYINSATTFGANMRAIGANIKIADSAGIDIDRVKFKSFLLSGIFLGVAGIVYISINVSVIGVTGFASASMIFDGIMGVFVAQVLTRYIDYNVAIVIGTITIRMLSAGLVACGLSSEMRGVLTGIFLFVVVAYSTNAGFLERLKAKRHIVEEANAQLVKVEP